MDIAREAANDDAPPPAPSRKGSLARAFQRFVLRREAPPAPFRDSDFESSEWLWSSFDRSPGPAAD